jgi:hypothetical protein
VLVAALAVEAFGQWRQRRRPLLPRLLAALAPAAGTSAYFALWALTGEPSAPLDSQQQWQRVLTSPLEAAARAVEFAVRYRSWWLIDLLVVAIVVATVVPDLRVDQSPAAVADAFSGPAAAVDAPVRSLGLPGGVGGGASRRTAAAPRHLGRGRVCRLLCAARRALHEQPAHLLTGDGNLDLL